jgi:hypothetical protein
MSEHASAAPQPSTRNGEGLRARLDFGWWASTGQARGYSSLNLGER